jgi:hypothetical protein
MKLDSHALWARRHRPFSKTFIKPTRNDFFTDGLGFPRSNLRQAHLQLRCAFRFALNAKVSETTTFGRCRLAHEIGDRRPINPPFERDSFRPTKPRGVAV